MDISLSSAGSLCVAVLAFCFFICQAWLFSRKTDLSWNAWGAGLSFFVAVYSFFGFIQYNTAPNWINHTCELIQYTCMIGLLHCVFGFTFSFLSIPPKGFHRIVLPLHGLLLLLLWLTPLFVGGDFITRQFFWVKGPFVEPHQGPLGRLLMLYIAAASLFVIYLWIRHARTRDAVPFFIGIAVWAVLGIHDALATLGMPTVQFLMQYGYLGFVASILSLTAKAYVRLYEETRNHAVQARREKDRLDATLCSMEDGFIAIDPQGTISLINEAAEKIFRKQPEEMAGRPATALFESVNPESRLILEALVPEVLEKGAAGTSPENLKVDGPRGETIHLSETHAPIRDESGNIVGAVFVFRDITGKLAEMALQESERRYKFLVDNTRDIIFTLDAEGQFTFVSPAWSKLLGNEPREVLSHSYRPFIHPDDLPACEAFLTRLRLEGQPEPSVEYRVRHVDGGWRWHTARGALVSNADGVPSFIGVARDITELREMEFKLNHASKMEAVGTLAGGIAHDFNNLLMGIQGYASLMMLNLEANHPHYEGLKAIEDQVKSAADLTRQLLGFARGGRYQVKPANLNHIVEKTSSLFGRTHKEIIICRMLQKDLWTVNVDQGQMEQVLINLYLNAMQAMPGGGELTLVSGNTVLEEREARLQDIRPGRYVRLSITDTGVGMDEKTRARIFDPFFTTKKMGRGTGLGLAMVYGIIRGHDGMIDVVSEVGHGSTFTIYLPASDQKPMLAEKKESEAFIRGTETVLLVDDERTILKVGQGLLEAMGYRVLSVSSGQAAIAAYLEKRGQIDLIILDMVMPGISGGEAFDRLREVDPDVKILLASGYSVEGEAQKILDRGCSGFIQKPFQTGSLSRKIREVLDRQPQQP